jgi:hypothetical protein
LAHGSVILNLCKDKKITCIEIVFIKKDMNILLKAKFTYVKLNLMSKKFILITEEHVHDEFINYQ